jgi:hypothetical protein
VPRGLVDPLATHRLAGNAKVLLAMASLCIEIASVAW